MRGRREDYITAIHSNAVRRSVARLALDSCRSNAAPHPHASGERSAAGGQDKEDQEIPSSLGTKVGRLARRWITAGKAGRATYVRYVNKIVMQQNVTTARHKRAHRGGKRRAEQPVDPGASVSVSARLLAEEVVQVEFNDPNEQGKQQLY